MHKVTIIPRGQALGVTFTLPEEDQYTTDEQKYLDKICVALGGRVAEEIFLGKIDVGRLRATSRRSPASPAPWSPAWA